MAKREKKGVTEGQVADWLKRADSGETLRQIAELDKYDVRTVRDHLQKALQERERQQARATVLRGALEDHYRDLCNYALRLDPANLPGIAIPSLPANDDIMEAALRKHLTRSPLWNLKTKKTNLELESRELLEKTKAEIEKLVSGNKQLRKLEEKVPEVVSGISQFFISQIDLRSKDVIGRKVSEYLQSVPDGNGFQLQLGFARLGYFKKATEAERYLEMLRPLIDIMEESVKCSEVFTELAKTNHELSKADEKLHEEISIIRMRRIVPGKCKYCPL